MHRIIGPRPLRRLLSLGVASLGVVLATLAATAGSAGAVSAQCDFAGLRPAANDTQPSETCGFGSSMLNDITEGDDSQLTVVSDPPALLDLRDNLDPPISCHYSGHFVYTGLAPDQYNVIVNGGSTVDEPTLTITLSSAVPGGQRGAQLLIYENKAQVCFGSPLPFTTRPGSALVLTNDPGIGPQYVGLLPDCVTRRTTGPCITGRTATTASTPTGTTGVVNVFFTVPPGYDPRMQG
jgi:hypothetical protein